uniref:hypothetical protein n=1 Tax=Lactococcus sp. TaxID=44273 RepID=UPI003242AF68
MYNLDKGQKIDIELEKYVAPVPKKSMTMKERIDKAKTKCSEKKPQETELKMINFQTIKSKEKMNDDQLSRRRLYRN